MNIKEAAKKYLEAGLSCLPAHAHKKHASVDWTLYQSNRLPAGQIDSVFKSNSRICILTGPISGNLEIIDFDCGGKYFEPWMDEVHKLRPDLCDKWAYESTPSGGAHIVYRHSGEPETSQKLAWEIHPVDGPGKYEFYGKNDYAAVQNRRTGLWEVRIASIETRGKGGLFLCDPSPGYKVHRGDFTKLEPISGEDRDFLIELARRFCQDQVRTSPHLAGENAENGQNQLRPRAQLPAIVPKPEHRVIDLTRPGDDYTNKHDGKDLLNEAGWEFVYTKGENEHWRRPGKADRSATSATYHIESKRFFVFSTNAYPLQAGQYYYPFDLLAAFRFDNDKTAAANYLYNQGYGKRDSLILPQDNFLCNRLGAGQTIDITDDDEDDDDSDIARIGLQPEEFPEHLLHVPGFVGELADYINRTSFTVQPNLALAASLCVLATLTGRRVQDSDRTRTNIYVIGTASTGDGKERGREVAKDLFEKIGKPKWMQERIMSYQGLIRTIDTHKTVMLAWDEFGRVLATINKDGNSHKTEIPTALLTLYSSASSTYYSDVRADERYDKIIKQPHLVLYGTSVPESLYRSMGEESLTNGLLGRMVIFDGVQFPVDQKPEKTSDGLPLPIPDRLVQIAKFWSEFEPGGNMHGENPGPIYLKTTPEAEEVYDELLDKKRALRSSRDIVRKALHSRVLLKAKQFGMVYACSENHKDPVITGPAARWGADVVEFLTENLLRQTTSWVADDDFSRKSQEVIRYLQSVGGVASVAAVNKRFWRWSEWVRENVLSNLKTSRIVVIEDNVPTGKRGRPATVFRLRKTPPN